MASLSPPTLHANGTSTFALCFWYSLKMHMDLQINSAETLIV